MRYWEDFEPGEVASLGPYEVTRDEILDFARRYDPQPFHVDEDAAEGGPFGLFVEGILLESASMGSPGVQELRWTAPVRPGDVLTARVRVVETYPSERRGDRGTVITESEVMNQDDVVVMTMRARGFFRRRP
jgi:acyl dehydratase